MEVGLNSYNRLNTRLDNRLNVCIQPVGQPVAYRVNEVAYNSDRPTRYRQTEYRYTFGVRHLSLLVLLRYLQVPAGSRIKISCWEDVLRFVCIYS